MKRRDACYTIRCLTPSPHLIAMGHEVREETLELGAHCTHPYCRGKLIEYHFSQETPFACSGCGLQFAIDTQKWKTDLLTVMDWADIIIFQRPTDLDHLRLMKKAKDMGKKIIFEGDDDYINVPQWNPGYVYYAQRKGIVEEMLRVSDGITVTTEPLRTVYKAYNKNIAVLPNSTDIEIVDSEFTMPDLIFYKKNGKQFPLSEYRERRQGKTVIGWGGSPTHEKDLEIVLSALKRIARKEEVLFAFVGYVHRALLDVLPEDQFFMLSLVPVSLYFPLYKTLHFDVGIMPVAPVKFNEGKSSNKLIEAHVLGILPVASDFVTYRDDIAQGFLASPNEEHGWVSALRKAIHCEDRAERLAANRKFAEEKYDIKNTVVQWDRFYRQTMEA